MERRNFLSLAFLLPLLNPVKSFLKDDEILRFDLSELEPLLKNMSAADRQTANLLMKNLALNLQYVIPRIKDPKDMEAIKKLALEADKKFYLENRLKASQFRHQPLNIEALEGLRNNLTKNSKAYEAMLVDIKEQLRSLQASEKTYIK